MYISIKLDFCLRKCQYLTNVAIGRLWLSHTHITRNFSKSLKTSPNHSKLLQITWNFSKSLETSPNHSKLLQITRNFSKSLKRLVFSNISLLYCFQPCILPKKMKISQCLWISTNLWQNHLGFACKGWAKLVKIKYSRWDIPCLIIWSRQRQKKINLSHIDLFSKTMEKDKIFHDIRTFWYLWHVIFCDIFFPIISFYWGVKIILQPQQINNYLGTTFL